jgi:AmmeMemoRadiSam system protein B
MEKEKRDHPKIRPIMAFPFKSEKGDAICLRDPEGFSDATLVINHATYLMVTLMDGTRGIRDIQADFMRQTGALIPVDQLQGLISRLREAMFMDDETFHLHRNKIEDDFIHAETRPTAHKGTAYPESAEELSVYLEGFFNTLKDSVKQNKPVAGIIAPHIDIRQAGTCYAAAYEPLRKKKFSTFIVLGTAHSNMGPFRYAICPKDFETPLGLLPCDHGGIKVIQDHTGRDWAEGQMSHRTEHSLEFQAVFLKHIFPRRTIRIIPVLCNSLADLLETPQGPMHDESVRSFTEAIRHLMNQKPGETALIAGADLSHMGPKFGHPRPLNETDLAALKTHDLALIRHMEEGNPEGFFKIIQKDKDHHNVCGVPNIYAFLKILEGRRGQLIDYGQYFEPPTASAVSYASLVF